MGTGRDFLTCDVKGHGKDAGFAFKGSGLGNDIGFLEAIAAVPVPEPEHAVVATGGHDAVFVDGNGVDDRLLLLNGIVQKFTLRGIWLEGGVTVSSGRLGV